MATILVVDDDPDIRRSLGRVLEHAGHRVVLAESAGEAMGTLRGPDRPDVVVSDVLMPGRNGLAFYGDLVAQAPELKNRVIFLTGASREPEVHRPIEQLGVPLLAKLDDLQLVADAVRLALVTPAR